MRYVLRTGLAAAVLMGGALLGAGRAENWPQWRGPAFNGSSPETGWPSTWSKTERLAGVTPLPGSMEEEPIPFLDCSLEGKTIHPHRPQPLVYPVNS